MSSALAVPHLVWHLPGEQSSCNISLETPSFRSPWRPWESRWNEKNYRCCCFVSKQEKWEYQQIWNKLKGLIDLKKTCENVKQTAGLIKSYYNDSPQTTWAVKFVEWFRLTIYDLQKTWKTYGGTTSTIKLNKLQQTGSQGLQIIVMQEHGHNTWQELLYHS